MEECEAVGGPRTPATPQYPVDADGDLHWGLGGTSPGTWEGHPYIALVKNHVGYKALASQGTDIPAHCGTWLGAFSTLEFLEGSG